MPRPLNTAKPRKGMFIQAYMYHKALGGGGIRSFMVLKVGPKFVELFYPPRLTTLRITRDEWTKLAVVENKAEQQFLKSREVFVSNLKERMVHYDKANARYNKAATLAAIRLCGGSDA